MLLVADVTWSTGFLGQKNLWEVFWFFAAPAVTQFPMAQLSFLALLITALHQQQEETKVWAKTTSFQGASRFLSSFLGGICSFHSESPQQWVAARG